MRFFTREAMDFIFDRWAVARPYPFDNTGVHWTAIEACANNIVGFFVRMSNPARNLLRMHRCISHIREYWYRIKITGLFLHDGEVDTAAINPWWRASFQATLWQRQLF